MFSQEADIVKTMRLIEGLKAELIQNVGRLYQLLSDNSERRGKELLAALIVNCYVLGKRLGINFNELDKAVQYRVNHCGANDSELENRFGDFSKLAHYLANKEVK